MRKKVFLDANVIISGTFFRGNEAKLFSIPDIDLYTCDVVVWEVIEVTRRKLKSLKAENLTVALTEVERSFLDFHEIVHERAYAHKMSDAQKLIKKGKDSNILAAVLYVKPDAFLTGDKDFHKDAIRSFIKVYNTRDFLTELGLDVL